MTRKTLQQYATAKGGKKKKNGKLTGNIGNALQDNNICLYCCCCVCWLARITTTTTRLDDASQLWKSVKKTASIREKTRTRLQLNSGNDALSTASNQQLLEWRYCYLYLSRESNVNDATRQDAICPGFMCGKSGNSKLWWEANEVNHLKKLVQ